MKILLTGGKGFVGSHIRESLGSRYEIIAPSQDELDVTDSARVDEAFRNGRFDAVIHGAIEGGPLVAETTLRGYWNIARHAHRVDRILYFGSGAEYGKHRDLVKVGEESIGEAVPRDPYGFAKLLCNQFCRASDNITNLRLFGIFGPYEGYAVKFISNAVAKTIAGLPLVIRQNVIFDYLWVEDLMRMLPRFLEGERLFADVNVTPTSSISLAEIAELVLRESQRPADFTIETPGLNFQYTGDNARLLQYCPSFEFTPVAEGVRRLTAFYRERSATIDRELLAGDAYRHALATRAAEKGTGK